MPGEGSRGAAFFNRRRFLQSAGLLAAGSAVSSALSGCGVDFLIPCLGPAAAPVPVAGMTYIRASEIGCALDCDLRTGRSKLHGGQATDDGPRINAAMAEASPAKPMTLIIDGSALISGLFLPAGGHWSIAGLGCGTGFYVKKGTNNDGIHNGPPDAADPSDPGPPAPARGSDVSLSNFTVNGNRGDGHDGNSTSGQKQGINGQVWYFGINLMNLDRISVEKVVVVNTSSYHIRFSNVGHVTVSGCVLRTYGASTDGLHFDGPANDIVISGCDITCDDDAIALNCPEGYSGDISRVSVTGCTFSAVSFMRLYTVYRGPAFHIETVNVGNCSGTALEAVFLIGLVAGSNPNSIDGLTITNCQFTGAAVLGLAENFGTITLSEVTYIPSQAYVGWIQPQENLVCGFVRPSPLTGNLVSIGTSLIFENCLITRRSDVEVAAVILESGSTIGSVIFSGFAVQDSHRALPELVNLDAGSVGELVLNSVTSTRIVAPVASGQFGRVSSVSGTGVLATGWGFPDSVMADDVPYVSASTGSPSIKVDGVVEPYSPS